MMVTIIGCIDGLASTASTTKFHNPNPILRTPIIERESWYLAVSCPLTSMCALLHAFAGIQMCAWCACTHTDTCIKFIDTIKIKRSQCLKKYLGLRCWIDPVLPCFYLTLTLTTFYYFCKVLYCLIYPPPKCEAKKEPRTIEWSI